MRKIHRYGAVHIICSTLTQPPFLTGVFGFFLGFAMGGMGTPGRWYAVGMGSLSIAMLIADLLKEHAIESDGEWRERWQREQEQQRNQTTVR